MTVPDVVDLGFAIIHVKWVTEQEMADECDLQPGDSAPWGAWSCEDSVIYLHKSLKRTPKRARQVFLHEMVHAIVDNYHLQT